MAKIIRVFGKADSFDIELTRVGKLWEVDVPPDLVDGVYAVQLVAINEFGESGIWTGELFMCNGTCCINFVDQPYRLWVKVKKYDTQISKKHNNSIEVIKPLQYTIQFYKRLSTRIIKHKELHI